MRGMPYQYHCKQSLCHRLASVGLPEAGVLPTSTLLLYSGSSLLALAAL